MSKTMDKKQECSTAVRRESHAKQIIPAIVNPLAGSMARDLNPYGESNQ